MSNSLRPTRVRLREVSLLAMLALASACAGSHRLVPVADGATRPVPGVSWLAPERAEEARTLARWRAAVGPPVIAAAAATKPADNALTIVSWNTALGAGDVAALFRDLNAQHPGRPIVLLLQEAFRGGDEVPSAREGVAFASHIRCASADREIDELARSLGLSLYYVPSMRNGAPGQTNEDRGNAILSTLPLENLTAIELPFERQRRVAIAATVRGSTPDGTPWRLRVASVHLDNRVGMNKAWIGSEYARTRQARGLRDALQGEEPLVLGGDFNTWFGFVDAAFRETARAFPQTVVTDRRRTFRGLMRLDHVFYRLPERWRAEVRRAESSLGSDHHPLIATLTF